MNTKEPAIALGQSISVSLLIPAFNDAEGLTGVLEKLKAASWNFSFEVIVVDDGSTDQTGEIAARYPVTMIGHHQNLGYGASLKTAIKAAKGEYVFFLDADGQHPIEKIPEFFAKKEDCAMISGHRAAFIHSDLWKMPGKWFLKWISEILVGKAIPDLNCGFRVLKRAVALRYLHICPNGFSFSTTLTMTMFCRGYSVKFIPIEVENRIGRSTVSIKTGFDTVLLIFRLISLFNPMRIFIPASFFSIFFGLLWTLPYIFLGKGVSAGSLLAIMTGVGLVNSNAMQVFHLKLAHMPSTPPYSSH